MVVEVGWKVEPVPVPVSGFEVVKVVWVSGCTKPLPDTGGSFVTGVRLARTGVSPAPMLPGLNCPAPVDCKPGSVWRSCACWSSPRGRPLLIARPFCWAVNGMGGGGGANFATTGRLISPRGGVAM